MYKLFFDLDDTILNLTKKKIISNLMKFGNINEYEIKKAYNNIKKE